MKILLDAGHGGTTISKGYVTPGKRSPQGSAGVIYEGVSNRAFVFDLAYRLTLAGKQVEVITDAAMDTTLSTRVRRVNEIVGHKGEEYLLLSIHSNAATGVFGSQTGNEIWTTKGEDWSDPYAEGIAKTIQEAFPETVCVWRMGKARQYDKEHDFTLIFGAKCPAVLLEIMFMDGTGDYDKLVNPYWRVRMVQALTEYLKSL